MGGGGFPLRKNPVTVSQTTPRRDKKRGETVKLGGSRDPYSLLEGNLRSQRKRDFGTLQNYRGGGGRNSKKKGRKPVQNT